MKTILVTGVSRGLGWYISKELLEFGYKVIGISRNKSELIKELEGNYPNEFISINFDLSNINEIKELFNSSLLKKTILSGFVNNAAIAYDDLITNANIDRLEEMFTINVLSPIILTKHVIRNMLLHQTNGSIVHISSISAHTGYKGLSMYAATKSALEAFSKNAAREWGSIGIRSNCIVSGFMETDMSSSLSSDQKKRIYERTSLKKPTNPESVASTIRFLLSDESASITGQNIHIDSGTI